MEISRVSSFTRCFCRMMTTSDAVHVAAASSRSSTGDVAAVESPSTRMGGRPVPFPSNCNCRSHRIVTSAVRAILVAPPRRESDEEAVPAHPVHAVVFEDPVEGRAVVELETERRIEPKTGALRIGAAPLATRHAEAQSDVRRRDLFVVGEAPQRFETADVRVGPVEEADLRRRAQTKAVGEQITEVQCRAQDQLARAPKVDAAAHAESEQADARAAVPGVLRRLELLRPHAVDREQTQCHQCDYDNTHSRSDSFIACVAALNARPPRPARRCARNPRLRTLQWPRWPTRGVECRSNRRWPPPG